MRQASGPGKPGRPLSQEFQAGKVFGFLTIKMNVRTKTGRKVVVQCVCGKRETIPTHYLTRKPYPKTSCGCKTYEGSNPYPREKGIWGMMHQRCHNPGHVSYKDYGGRGIFVCPEWHKDNPEGWNNFIKFVGPAPSKKHTIDRVNPNLGYQPYQEDGVTPQVRWATPKEQANNTRRHWAEKGK